MTRFEIIAKSIRNLVVLFGLPVLVFWLLSYM